MPSHQQIEFTSLKVNELEENLFNQELESKSPPISTVSTSQKISEKTDYWILGHACTEFLMSYYGTCKWVGVNLDSIANLPSTFLNLSSYGWATGGIGALFTAFGAYICHETGDDVGKFIRENPLPPSYANAKVSLTKKQLIGVSGEFANHVLGFTGVALTYVEWGAPEMSPAWKIGTQLMILTLGIPGATGESRNAIYTMRTYNRIQLFKSKAEVKEHVIAANETKSADFLIYAHASTEATIALLGTLSMVGLGIDGLTSSMPIFLKLSAYGWGVGSPLAALAAFGSYVTTRVNDEVNKTTHEGALDSENTLQESSLSSYQTLAVGCKFLAQLGAFAGFMMTCIEIAEPETAWLKIFFQLLALTLAFPGAFGDTRNAANNMHTYNKRLQLFGHYKQLQNEIESTEVVTIHLDPESLIDPASTLSL